MNWLSGLRRRSRALGSGVGFGPLGLAESSGRRMRLFWVPEFRVYEVGFRGFWALHPNQQPVEGEGRGTGWGGVGIRGRGV